MKIHFIFILSFLLALGSYGQSKSEAIVKYAENNMGKKIDRGECWDLVAFALDDANVEWEKPFGFGTPIDVKSTSLLPGDIISFDGVKFESENGYQSFPMHYAIVYKVIDKDHLVIMHQNHNNKKVVQTLDLDLTKQTKGKMKFFRVKE